MLYGELPEIPTADGQVIRGYPIKIERPEKTAVLRLPSTEEMLEYLSKQRTSYQDLGRRKGINKSIPNPKSDQALFEKIRLDKGQEFDPDEAAHALGLLTQQKISSCEREGENYRITLTTMFGDTVHVISIPFQKDLAQYRRNVYQAIDLPHGLEERRFPPEAPIKLYDAAIVSIEGYVSNKAADVPPHHKQSVVFELVNAVNDLDPALDPNS